MAVGDIRRAFFATFLPLVILSFLPSMSRGDDAGALLAAAGWQERVAGRWYRIPERKAQILDNGVSGEFVLTPGTGVVWEKRGTFDISAGGMLSFELYSNGTNPSSDDYRRYRARFPAAVTVVFGDDSQALSWKERFREFFRGIWHGFPPGGIRLTYAFGNRVPPGSMYRTADEETVFILAGEEEKGKSIQAKRDLREDFLAAYGRAPKGRVTRFILRAERPSKEKGSLTSRIVLALPGP